MRAYRSRMPSALDGLDLTPMEPDWRDNNRTILQNNIAFMDDCLRGGRDPFAKLEAFGKKQAPYLAKNVAWAAQTAGQALDDGAGGLESAARWRLGQDLRGQQHHLCGASEQRDLQRAGAVLRSRCHERPLAADRDDLVHDDARRHAPVADPHHCGQIGRLAVLRQLSPHGLRADGRRRALSDHRGDQQARHDAVPAARRAVWLKAMADPQSRRVRDRRRSRTSASGRVYCAGVVASGGSGCISTPGGAFRPSTSRAAGSAASAIAA